MRLSVKFAGVCSSGTFLLTMLVACWQHMKPTGDVMAAGMEVPLWTDLFNMLVMSLSASAVAGVLGYLMGDILSKPRGQRKTPEARQAREPAAPETPAAPVHAAEEAGDGSGAEALAAAMEAVPPEER